MVSGAYLFIHSFLHFGPGVAEADGSVEDELAFGAVGIDAKIAHSLELIPA